MPLYKQQRIITDYELIGKLSKELGAPMKGIEISQLSTKRSYARAWLVR